MRNYICFGFRLLALLASLPTLALANNGPITSGGGDEVALEFTQAFRNAYQEIQANHPDLAAQLNGQDLEAAMKRASLFVVEQTLKVEYQGIQQESVATNTPASGWILINRYRWQQIRQQRIREAVALHEVASLLELEGTGRYPISSAYLGKYQLEADPALILSGKAPASDSAFRLSRSSCETQLVSVHRKSGKKFSTSYHTLNTAGSWDIRGNTYNITYFYTTSPESSSVPWLSKTKSAITQRDGGLHGDIDSTMLFIDADHAEVQESPQQVAYFTENREGVVLTYAWENGAKAQLMSRQTSARLPEGGVRTVTLLETEAFPEDEFAIDGSSDTCTTKTMSLEAWLTLVDDPQVAAEITRLDHLAFLANDADRKIRTCAPETCEALKSEGELREQEFVAAWNKLYEDRKSDISKKYEAVRKKWQEQERARQRQIQRQRQRSNPSMGSPYRRTPAEENASRAIIEFERRNRYSKIENELKEIRRELERSRGRRY